MGFTAPATLRLADRDGSPASPSPLQIDGQGTSCRAAGPGEDHARAGSWRICWGQTVEPGHDWCQSLIADGMKSALLLVEDVAMYRARWVNRSEEGPSMSARAETTRLQIARIAQTNLEQMSTQLKQWGRRLELIGATDLATDARARIGRQPALDILTTKYRVARKKFEEFERAGARYWPLFRSGIERAWVDFEKALGAEALSAKPPKDD